MTDLSSKTFLVKDHHGLFICLARRLAETGAKVFYQTPTDRRDGINEAVIGDGMAKSERGPIVCVDDLWLVKRQVDCFVFPDIRHAGEQVELREQGYPVWGAGLGMQLELDRLFFLKKLEEFGLDVPPYEVVTGVSALREHLKDKENIWVKLSKWRGSWETFHWRSWQEDAHRFDIWGVRFGGVKELLNFICFPEIDTKLEIGGDTYNVDGQWPSLMLHGIEAKDKAYFGAVTQRDHMPKELLPVMEAFSPFLKQSGYRQQWSMEVRVTDEASFFIDCTTRGGLPSTGSQILAMSNLPEVIFHGAAGNFVEAQYNCKFTAECMVSVSGEQNAWETIVLPDELRPHLMLADYCEVNGQPWFPCDEDKIDEIGWLVATGDTPTETAQRMNELADMLPDGADAAVESLADIIREVEAEQDKGIRFTDAPMPEPEIVLAPSKKGE